MKLLTPRETAAQLRVSLSTLRGWRKAGKGPPVVELGPGLFRYSEDDLQQFIVQQKGDHLNGGRNSNYGN